MSAIPSAIAGRPARSATVQPPRQAVSRWRFSSIVLGAAVGQCFSFIVLFSSTLPFFLLPLSQEFGWGRGDTAAATVLAMLGVAMASPLTGRLFDRYGTEPVIGASVLLFSAAVFAMSWLPGSLIALGALCFAVGVLGSGTSMIGYAGVLPQWFDRRLGLALGVSGFGAAVGIGLSPFVATRLIEHFGWRGAYTGLAGLALAGGLLAFGLLRLRRGEIPPLAPRATSRAARAVENAAVAGMTFQAALRDARFWLLLGVIFIVPFSILGMALHGAALFIDRGFTPEQAAIGAATAGVGAILARGIGALIDRWHAPYVTAGVFAAAAAALFVNSGATTLPVLCLGTFLGGASMGAEGDILPFMVRRYFGLRAFGSVFGAMFAAYALGGALGPVAYGYTYDRFHGYGPAMLVCATACLVCAGLVAWMGPYRYKAETPAH